ncbi:MAG: zinc dependent phospholipase C family protein, partial [Patescibacteria group bacterium]
MPGPFFHLWLAERVYPDFIKAAGLGKYNNDLLPYFRAGVIAPDIGFYPDGPLEFSKTVHDFGHTGQFLRVIHERSVLGTDQAFMAGWALHVYTDLAIHPLVDRAVKDCYRGQNKKESMFWHMRLEWGMDCAILETKEAEKLWRCKDLISFPSGSAGILVSAMTDVYSQKVSMGAMLQGYRSIIYWVKIIPHIFFWGGHVS